MPPITKFAGVIQNLPGDVDEITGTTTGLVTTSDSRADHVPHVVLPQGVGSAIPFPIPTPARAEQDQDGGVVASRVPVFSNPFDGYWRSHERPGFKLWLKELRLRIREPLNNAGRDGSHSLAAPASEISSIHSGANTTEGERNNV